MDLSAYIGLPFEDCGRDRNGLDCWGLVRLVLHEQWGVEVPSWHTDYADPDARAEVGALIEQRRDGAWLEVAAGDVQPGDVVLLRWGRHVCHVGIMTGPKTMLHIQRGFNSALERIDGLVWVHKVHSFWRHKDLAGVADAA